MTGKRDENQKRKKVDPKKVKIPQVEFNLKAIKEIKKRKKEVYKGDSKQSTTELLEIFLNKWSGRGDLNSRLLGPEARKRENPTY